MTHLTTSQPITCIPPRVYFLGALGKGKRCQDKDIVTVVMRKSMKEGWIEGAEFFIIISEIDYSEKIGSDCFINYYL